MFGRYELHGVLGRGGMGEVFRAFDTVRERTVALKLLPKHLATDDSFQARFRRESRLAAKLNEPHIIPIHDFGEVDGQLFIDMRLVEGRDLGSTLERGGPLDTSTAVSVITQVAAALDAAHESDLVHRDVKPSNVLLTGWDDSDRDGDPFAYLVDFGIARSSNQEGTALTATSGTVGTVAYMAPERIGGDPGDKRADVYSLACMLYETLTGKKPFDGEAFAVMYAHMHTDPPAASDAQGGGGSASLDDVIKKGMAKSPDERYETAGEFAKAARTAARTRVATPAPPPPPTGRPIAFSRPPTRTTPHPTPAAPPPPTGRPLDVPRPPSTTSQPSQPTAPPGPAAPNAPAASNQPPTVTGPTLGQHPSGPTPGYPGAQTGGYAAPSHTSPGQGGSRPFDVPKEPMPQGRTDTALPHPSGPVPHPSGPIGAPQHPSGPVPPNYYTGGIPTQGAQQGGGPQHSSGPIFGRGDGGGHGGQAGQGGPGSTPGKQRQRTILIAAVVVAAIFAVVAVTIAITRHSSSSGPSPTRSETSSTRTSASAPSTHATTVSISNATGVTWDHFGDFTKIVGTKASPTGFQGATCQLLGSTSRDIPGVVDQIDCHLTHPPIEIDVARFTSTTPITSYLGKVTSTVGYTKATYTVAGRQRGSIYTAPDSVDFRDVLIALCQYPTYLVQFDYENAPAAFSERELVRDYAQQATFPDSTPAACADL